MGNRGKRALSVVIGLLSAMIVLTLLEFINSKIFAFPEGIDRKDPLAIKAAIEAMPFGAKVLQLISYFISAFVGGLVATKLVNGESHNSALIIGSILTFFGLINSVALGEPIWMGVCSFLMHIPGAYLGYRVLANKGQRL